jgi:hypothetical protein
MFHLWLFAVNFNRLQDKLNCLSTLAASSRLIPPIVGVDNASADDRRPALRAELPGAQLVCNQANSAWAGGNNTGIVYAFKSRAEGILFLNNDTIVAPDFAECMLTAGMQTVLRFAKDPVREALAGILAVVKLQRYISSLRSFTTLDWGSTLFAYHLLYFYCYARLGLFARIVSWLSHATDPFRQPPRRAPA